MKGFGLRSPCKMQVHLFLFFLFCLFSAGSHAAGTDVSMRDGNLSVLAVDRPLSEIMGRIANVSGIDISVAPEVDKPVSFAVSDRPLKVLLDKIAREQDLNVIIGWKRLGEESATISSVMILPPNQVADEQRTASSPGMDWERQARRQFNKDKAREEREKRKLERAAKRNQQ